MKDLPQIVLIIGFVIALALTVAAILMPIVVICIDSRIAKISKTMTATARTLAAMESMMRNGK